MAFDESLATRVRLHLASDLFTEHRVFGGVVFLVNGNMACGIIRDELLVRTGLANFEPAISRPFARPMDFTGRPMRGMVIVSRDGLDDESLADWVALGQTFARSLPPKVKSRPPRFPATRRASESRPHRSSGPG